MKMPVFDYSYLFDPRVPDHPELLFRKKWVQFPVLFFLILWIGGLPDLNGQNEWVDYSLPGGYVDWRLPPHQTDYDIKFSLTGADGGIGFFAGSSTNFCAGTVEGGSGAVVNVTYRVGSDELIKPEATIRFITGERGDTYPIGTDCESLSGSGGGGTAVLVRNLGSTDWIIIAVAGGGGGGHVFNLGPGGQGGGRGEGGADIWGPGIGGGASLGYTGTDDCQRGGAAGGERGGNGGDYKCGIVPRANNGMKGGWGFGGGGPLTMVFPVVEVVILVGNLVVLILLHKEGPAMSQMDKKLSK